MSQYDPARREKVQQENKSKRDQRLDDLRQLLATAHGRRYLKGLVAFHGVFNALPTNNNTELLKAVGKREAGLKIYGELFEANPDLAVQMFGELI